MSTVNVTSVKSATNLTFDTNSTERARFDSSGKFGLGTNSPTAALEVVTAGGVKLLSTPLMETAHVIAATSNSVSNIDLMDGSVKVFTTASSGNWSHNVRGNGSTSRSSMMATGQVAVYTLISTLGGSSGYSNALSIDGSSQSIKWQGATPSARGGTSGYDVYTYTIIKTGSSSYIVLGQTSTYN